MVGAPRSTRLSSRRRPMTGGSEPPLEVQVRAAEAGDEHAVMRLVNTITEELFGPFNVIAVIEKAIFAVTLVDMNEEVVGFAAFYDHPNVPGVHPGQWEAWAETEFGLPRFNDRFTSFNTVFLHLFVTKPDFAVGCVQEIIRSVLAAVPQLNQILLCVPVHNHPDPALSDLFKPINKTVKASSNATTTIFIAKRQDFAPVLHIRTAKMEDNDDLTPIFARHKNRLRETYGDFFVAELIDSQDDDHKALVAEANGRACGFMSLSTNVNLDLLNATFELGPFHGLRKPDEGDILEEPKESEEDLEQEQEEVKEVFDYEATIVLLGDENTGKSSLMKTAVSLDPNPLPESLSPQGFPQVSLRREAFEKKILLNLVKLPGEITEDNEQAVVKAIQAADCATFLYNNLIIDTFEHLPSVWGPLVQAIEDERQAEYERQKQEAEESAEATEEPEDTDENPENPEAASKEVAAVAEPEKPDAIIKAVIGSRSDGEAFVDITAVDSFAARFSASLMPVNNQESESVSNALYRLTEVIARNTFGLATPKIEQDILEMAEVPPTPIDPPAQLPQLEPAFQQTFVGASNCFCVQLFCIKDEFETRSTDFLAHAFQCFPDRDFLILTVPHLVPEFALLQSFVRVPPRMNTTLQQELYVFHRCGLLADFHVRPSISDDFPAVEKLTASIENSEAILEDLQKYNEARRDKDGTPLHAFSAICSDQVVGVAIVRQEENIEYLKSHYNIEDFIYYSHHARSEHGHLFHFVLNPIFAHLTKLFLKEIMRQDVKSSLFYPTFPTTAEEADSSHTLVTCMSDLVPVKPRRQISYPVDSLFGNIPSERVLKEEAPFALLHINRKLVLEPKIAINARIVVVGASDAGLAFLESLAFSPHLKFNNLTLVSPHGLPGELAVTHDAKHMLPSSLAFTKERLDKISLKSWINIVFGKCTGINRKSKLVITDDGSIVPYDHLILATGTQFQVPFPVGIYGNASEEDIYKEFEQPTNLFTINDEFEADQAVYYIKAVVAKSQEQVIVYGSSLEAYMCVHTLLRLGVSGERITFVHAPRVQGQADCFNNPDVLAAVQASLDAANVVTKAESELYSWDLDPSNAITTVTFRVGDEYETCGCGTLFAYAERRVDYSAFRAVNDSCLIFDGRVVIDSQFHTNDTAIRACGPLTKFSRRYHADQWSHANFYSRQVGHELACSLLKLFDPTIEEDDDDSDELNKLIPIYTDPKVTLAQLPGGLTYLDVRKPSLNVPVEERRQTENYGRELVTGDAANAADTPYFLVHVNAYNSVETVTCLAKSCDVRHGNLLCLYGKNEKFLNNLVSRFDEGLITDFYTYFNEPWAMALFHDRFQNILDEIRDILKQPPPDSDEAESEVFAKKIRDLVEENLTIKSSEMRELLTDYKKEGYKRAVETRLLSYLSYNYYHLPMYAKPGMV